MVPLRLLPLSSTIPFLLPLLCTHPVSLLLTYTTSHPGFPARSLLLRLHRTIPRTPRPAPTTHQDVAPLDVTLDLSGGDHGAAGDRFGKRAGALEVDRRRGAVVVNAELAASSRVWVAGDAACFPSQAHGGRRLVIRSADHAHHSGRVAGENMAAAAAATCTAGGGERRGVTGGAGDEGGRRYRHTPAFVGEAPLAGVRLAMIGECDAAMPTHGFW